MKKRKMIAFLLCLLLSLGMTTGCSYFKDKKYNRAKELYAQGEIITAAEMMEKLDGYKDSQQLAADYYFEGEDYTSAQEMYYPIMEFSEDNVFRYALCCFYLQEYDFALTELQSILDYPGAAEYISKLQLIDIAQSDINETAQYGSYPL